MSNNNDYTPTSINEIVFKSDVERIKIEAIVNGKKLFPAHGKNGILLYGTNGAGKTTLAEMLPDAIERHKSGANAKSNCKRESCKSGPRGVKLVNSLETTAKTNSLNGSGYRYFILDELDALPDVAQASLKSVMNIDETIFVMTTNHYEKIDRGIIDRSICISFDKTPPEAWLPLAHRILRDEKIADVEDDMLIKIIMHCNGSGREIIERVLEIGLCRMLKNQGAVLNPQNVPVR